MSTSSQPSAITVSLEWAKRLKEAGWPQEESLSWHWTYRASGGYGGLKHGRFWRNKYLARGEAHKDCYPAFAAPTAEEILRELPDNMVEVNDKWYLLNIAHRYCSLTDEDDEPLVEFSGDTLVDSLAAMYCYLANHSLLPCDD